jgi:HAD superfamily hydrolase (TIGR01509 family)
MLCVIFDLDGTLVDSEPLSNRAMLDLLPQLEDTVSGLEQRYRGMQLARVFSDLALRLGAPLPEDFEVAYRAHVAKLYDESLVPMPGALEMLSALPNPKCVASNGPMAKTLHGLRVCGMAHLFGDSVFSAYQIGRWKPDPGLFLHAASAMNHSPDKCIVVEDSEAGLEAAAAAGMRAIHFSPHNVQRSRAAYASVKTLYELPEVIGKAA